MSLGTAARLPTSLSVQWPIIVTAKDALSQKRTSTMSLPLAMVAINPYVAVPLLPPIWCSLVPLRLSPIKNESFLNER
jgi:hypothetical protein